jgi:alkanesulfonate monooxygenase SsuD/methylene tetrahydromethanopterin reductase-like flavin-dependent oxidoreductase (luciferase family)
MHNVIDLPDLALTELADFGRRAEAEGYDAIVAADRPGSEPLVALAAVAAATERIGLVATLLMQPERSTALLARQAATLDVLSGGRLTVVLEVGHGAPRRRCARRSGCWRCTRTPCGRCGRVRSGWRRPRRPWPPERR